ncbi:AAA family ATPase [Streptomyces sp. F63]|uniref:AAA family ATPase n=1 Tax=Streptomyces sp. F63 TaxID=2824887 RepID=UPI001B398C0C|nr:AAA family ATPase [Streptomyces sp. F63]MBQ0985205.1 AAA family ATPase [Streptomyces sp. F63]
MRWISEVKISGLFGYVDHDVEFTKESPITIISGPNGIGKTHFLRLLHALISLDLDTLASVEFAAIEVRFTDKFTLRASPHYKEGEVTGFHLSVKRPLARKFQDIIIPYSGRTEGTEGPEWAVRLPDGNWFDTRMDRLMSRDVARRWGLKTKPSPQALVRTNASMVEVYEDARSILVDTQRLDAVPIYPGKNHRPATANTSGTTVTRIRLYIDQVAAQLEEARRRSLNESLDADQSFAARVLQKARTTINEKDLKERYQRIADQHAELHASGLSVRPVDVRFPEEKTTPTERRILNVFLDDWERKLQPLLPIHEKLKSLRRIVETKFIGKEMFLSPRGQIRFRSKINGRPVAVHALSSGEQHLLAVFSMLLFSARSGSLVLIDEPEISMHAAWKHSFLDDISEVARLARLQIALATHSSAIINGNWDLVREIAAPSLPDAKLAEVDADEDLDSEV